MSWSYSGNPGDSDKDLLRFNIGDVNPQDPELQDEEIQYEINKNISTNPTLNVTYVSLILLRRIRARYKSLNDEKVGDVDISWSQRYKQIKDLIIQFEAELATENLGGVYAGGICVSDKKNRETNVERVNPSFTRNFGNNPRNPYNVADSRTPPT